MNITDFLSVARKMPALRHNMNPGGEFDESKSEVLNWLAATPAGRDVLLRKARQWGVVSFDSMTGLWCGIGGEQEKLGRGSRPPKEDSGMPVKPKGRRGRPPSDPAPVLEVIRRACPDAGSAMGIRRLHAVMKDVRMMGVGAFYAAIEKLIESGEVVKTEDPKIPSRPRYHAAPVASVVGLGLDDD